MEVHMPDSAEGKGHDQSCGVKPRILEQLPCPEPGKFLRNTSKEGPIPKSKPDIEPTQTEGSLQAVIPHDTLWGTLWSWGQILWQQLCVLPESRPSLMHQTRVQEPKLIHLN